MALELRINTVQCYKEITQLTINQPCGNYRPTDLLTGQKHGYSFLGCGLVGWFWRRVNLLEDCGLVLSWSDDP